MHGGFFTSGIGAETECQQGAFSLNLKSPPYLAPSSDLQDQPEQANTVTSPLIR